jgi:hypothetical protein
MSGLDFSGLKTGNFISKELQPGVQVAKINKISIEKKKNPKDASVPEYELFIELEGKPMGGEFVGFDKVFGDPSKGQYAGQFKRIKSSNWPIKAYSYTDKKTGKQVTKNVEVQVAEFFQKILNLVKNPNWIKENASKFNTLEQFVTEFNRSRVFKDVYFKWLLAATETINAEGYPKHYIFLPDYKTAKTYIAEENGIVTDFDQSVHIIKDKKTHGESASLEEGIDDSDLDDDFADAPDDDLFEMED